MVTGGRVDQSILAPGVRVNDLIVSMKDGFTIPARAEVRDSVLFDGVDVGEGAIIRRAILDKNGLVIVTGVVSADLDGDAPVKSS